MTPDTLARVVAHVERALAVFHPAGDTVEIRALNVQGRRAVCLTSADIPLLARRAAELSEAGASGVYFTLNPLRPDLAGSKASCKKADVLFRRWLPLDIDPYRPRDMSSSEAELQAAWAVLDRCRALLDAARLRGVVVGCSGNGWHLCYPLELPNDDDSQALIKAVLKGLHARCGDVLDDAEKASLAQGTPLTLPKAKVEEDVHDAPRIWKLYGTRARKGPHTPERPHRWARLIEGQAWEASTAQGNVAALRVLLESWRFAEDARRGRPATSAESYARAALRQELAAIAGTAPGERNNQLNRSAFALGQLVGSGALARSEVETALAGAASAAGLGESEAATTIRSGIEAGLAQPRNLSAVGTGAASATARVGARANGSSTVTLLGESYSLATTQLDTVRIEPVRWLVPDLIPLGKLTMIAGDGGHGKSSITLDLIASLSTGRVCWGLDFAIAPICDSLIISCEDDLADTVVPRLLTAGADMARVRHVDGIRGADGKLLTFSLTHYEALDDHLACHPDTRLVVIDPAGAYVGSTGIDDHKDSDLRSLLAPLAVLAARRHVAILIVKHLNKGANHKAVARVGGSAGYVNAVRSALLVAPDPEDETRKILVPLKTNLTRRPVGLAYRLVSLTSDEAGTILAPLDYLVPEDRLILAGQLYRVCWLGPVSISADDALAPIDRKKQAGDLERATEWLRAFLAGGPRHSRDCCDQGNAALGFHHGLPWWRDKVLKETLGGKPRKTGFGSDQVWWFALPETTENAEKREDGWTPFTNGEDASQTIPD